MVVTPRIEAMQTNSMENIDPIAGLRRFVPTEGFDVVIDLKQSSGLWIQDARSGRRFLDFFSFVTSNALGMNHPAFQDPSFREKLHYAACHKVSNSDIYTLEQAEFVETFARIARPTFMPHLFFIEGGTLAVENSLKAAFDWKVRLNFSQGEKVEKGHQVIHFRQAFHGRSGYCLSLTNTIDPAKTQYYPKFSWPRINNPKLRFPLTPDTLWEVSQAEEESSRQIEQAFDEHSNDIAAILIEPIQGEGGDNHFRQEFFLRLRRFADQRQVLLIFDEVQTGLGMTGKMWGYEHTGIVPDMIVFGKKTLVCGFLCSSRIDLVPDNVFAAASRISSTWGGNLADMVRCQRVLEVLQKDRLVDNAERMGHYMFDRLSDLAEENPQLISNCRAAGLMQAFDLPDPNTRKRFLENVFSLGLLLLPCGHSAVRLRPPLIVGQEEIDRAFTLIRQALRRTRDNR